MTLVVEGEHNQGQLPPACTKYKLFSHRIKIFCSEIGGILKLLATPANLVSDLSAVLSLILSVPPILEVLACSIALALAALTAPYWTWGIIRWGRCLWLKRATLPDEGV